MDIKLKLVKSYRELNTGISTKLVGRQGEDNPQRYNFQIYHSELAYFDLKNYNIVLKGTTSMNTKVIVKVPDVTGMAFPYNFPKEIYYTYGAYRNLYFELTSKTNPKEVLSTENIDMYVLSGADLTSDDAHSIITGMDEMLQLVVDELNDYFKEEFKKVNANISGLKQEIVEFEKSIDETISKINEILEVASKETIAKIKSDLQAYYKTLKDLLDGDYNSIKLKIDQLNKRLDELKLEIDKLKLEVKGLQGNVVDLDEDIVKLEDRFDDVDMNGMASKEWFQNELSDELYGDNLNVSVTSDFKNKIAGSEVENASELKWTHHPNLQPPNSQVWNKANQTYIDNIKKLDGATFNSNATSNNAPQILISWNILEIVTRKYPQLKGISVDVLKTLITKVNYGAHLMGSGPSNKKVSMAVWQNYAWVGTQFRVSETVVPLYQSPSDMVNKIDLNGFLHNIFYADPSDGVTPSLVSIDYTSIEIELDKQSYNEFLFKKLDNPINGYRWYSNDIHARVPSDSITGLDLLSNGSMDWNLGISLINTPTGVDNVGMVKKVHGSGTFGQVYFIPSSSTVELWTNQKYNGKWNGWVNLSGGGALPKPDLSSAVVLNKSDVPYVGSIMLENVADSYFKISGYFTVTDDVVGVVNFARFNLGSGFFTPIGKNSKGYIHVTVFNDKGASEHDTWVASILESNNQFILVSTVRNKLTNGDKVSIMGTITR